MLDHAVKINKYNDVIYDEELDLLVGTCSDMKIRIT